MDDLLFKNGWNLTIKDMAGENDYMTIPENTLPASASAADVAKIRVLDAAGNSEYIALADLRLADTQITNNSDVTGATVSAALDTLKGSVDTLGTDKANVTTQVIAGNGLTGGGTLASDRTLNVAATDDSIVVAADGIKVDTVDTLVSTSATKPLSAARGKVLSETDVANYAKSVEMIAHDAEAPSPVIPTGTTKTYEFSSGGVCAWLANQVVEKGDKVTVAFTAPSTFVRTYQDVVSVIKTQSNQGNFYGLIDLANTFPYYAIKSISLIGCNNISDLYTSGVPKDLYLVYLRKKNVSNATTIIQIGEKIGASVGVGVNTFATFSDSNEVGTINNYILTGNNGVRVSLTIDWSLVGESAYNMDIQVPINIHKFIGEAESFLNAKKRDFWKNPTNTEFNYSAITRIEAVKGSRSLLYKSDGTLKELYLTYMRLNTNQEDSNIIQIAWKDDATVGVNDKIFVTTIDDFRDMSAKPITEFTLKGGDEFAGLEFSMIVDTSIIPTSILSNVTLSDSLQLNTILFAEQLRAAESGQNFQNKQIVCLGDSVTEFGTYPEQIADITGATTHKIGFGGCRLAERSDSADYNQLGMVKISEAIKNNDFTAMQVAVANLAALPIPDDNTAAFNRLTAIDFSKVDFITIFYGTNDFTGEGVIGTTGSTDTYTIFGAVNKVVENLLTAYPNLRILFITPTHRYFNVSDDSDLVPNVSGKYLIEYCDAIISEARINHIPALDMYRDGGLNKYNHAYYFGTDNVHPNATGYTYLAQKFSAALNSLFKF